MEQKATPKGGRRMNPNRIEVGDIVNIWLNDGGAFIKAEILHEPQDTEDSWIIKTSDSRIVYIQQYHSATLMIKKEESQ
jgi:hypothetical protein